MNEIEIAAVAALLRRASERVANVLGTTDPDRRLRAAQRACRRADARIENLRRELEKRLPRSRTEPGES
jgi:hypothetical protein